LSYGIILWGNCSNRELQRLFILQKKAIRIIGKLKFRDSYKTIFTQLGFLTLTCLYIFETILFCRYKCKLTQGREIHNYHTRYNNNFRTLHHRLNVFSNLPAQAGVKLINKLPENIKN
ncbi:hypothetical protein, partial [Klebsiella pneumoniae]|uniref:hypothetical protein n=1 Tax=Klebsiella pneumoniae TaxID=573 RepID=UPI001C8F20C4